MVEVLHVVDWISNGPWPNRLSAEQFVYDMLQTFFWKFLSRAQQQDAQWQVQNAGGRP